MAYSSEGEHVLSGWNDMVSGSIPLTSYSWCNLKTPQSAPLTVRTAKAKAAAEGMHQPFTSVGPHLSRLMAGSFCQEMQHDTRAIFVLAPRIRRA
ncbi:MAG: hypothetical protein [Caudoviricetes sp.]|nr:MAG: hypothetical protein [Caudoviricetes sp.]